MSTIKDSKMRWAAPRCCSLSLACNFLFLSSNILKWILDYIDFRCRILDDKLGKWNIKVQDTYLEHILNKKPLLMGWFHCSDDSANVVGVALE